MKVTIFSTLIFAFLLAGCVTQSECNRRVREAYLAGKNQSGQPNSAGQIASGSVWVMGKVKNPSIPWYADLTLSRAVAQADYQGAGDPREIIVHRDGTSLIRISAQKLLSGFDMPLLAGDRVEVR